MRFRAVAAMSFVAAATLAAAQQSSAPKVTVGPPITVDPGVAIESSHSTYVIVGAGCPGQLVARQQATGGATVWTTAQEDATINRARPSGLGVHVQFAGIKTPVKTLELRVGYEPVGLKRMPVALGTNGFASATSEREKNFTLDREAAMRVDADLLVGPAATITRVHLLSAIFADGSVWRAPSEEACSVVPSRIVLVNSK